MMHRVFGVAIATVLACGVAFAEEGQNISNEEVMAQLRQLQKTVAQQQEQIASLKSELEDAKSLAAPTEALKDEHVRALIRQELVARPAAGMPAWSDGLIFGGDFRLRYEGIYGRKGTYTQALATDTHGRRLLVPSGVRSRSPDDRSRFRYRLRFGFEKAITEELTLGFRLASGVAPGGVAPITDTDETLGDLFRTDDIWIDQAYLKYQPSAVPGLTILAGKHPNNWDDVAKTGVMWDPDVQPEGFQIRYDHKCTETLSGWAQAEYLVIMENDAVLANGRWAEDVDALAYQIGAKADLTESVSLTGALSYYNFMNMDDPTVLAAANQGTWSGGNWVGQDSGGANRIVEDFDVIVADAELGFKVGEIPCAVFGQYIQNRNTSHGNSEDEAWAGGVRVNEIKQKGDWAAQVHYARVERDAIIAGFGDDDCYFSNYRGTIGKVSYGLFDHTEVSGKVFCLDKLTGDSDSIIKTQLDMTVKF